MWPFKKLLLPTLATLLVHADCFAAAPLPDATANPEIYRQLDIVPMPKQIKSLEENLSLKEPMTIVLGENKVRQSEIGAEWIRKAIEKRGGNIPAVSVVPAEKGWNLIVGGVDENPLIKQAVDAKIVDVGKNNPGERGYEIRVDRGKRRVYLAGSDPIGTLYACVTFGELLKDYGDAAQWPMFEVRDWPDGINMFVGTSKYWIDFPELFPLVEWPNLKAINASAENRENFLKAFDAYMETLLRHKITLFLPMMVTLQGEKFAEKNFEWLQPLRTAIKLAEDRGIGAYPYLEEPFVGLKKNYPQYAKYDIPVCPLESYRKWIRCWGLDDVRRETAGHYGEYIKFMGYSHMGFHDTDTGSSTSAPAQWDLRNEDDRKRWGDDYTAALINKVSIYIDEIKKRNPRLALFFILIPYMYEVLDQRSGELLLRGEFGDSPEIKETAEKLRKQWTTHFERLNAALPKDVALGVREGHVRAYTKFRDIMGGKERPCHLWLAVDILWPIFSKDAALSGSFVVNNHDVIEPRYADLTVPLTALAIREYTWNLQTPGHGLWEHDYTWGDDRIKASLRATDKNSPVTALILPRVIRNLFGDQLAPYIVEAIGDKPFYPSMILGYVRNPNARKLTASAAFMKEQEKIAENGAAAMDRAWNAFKREDRSRYSTSQVVWLTYLREMYHVCDWMSKITYQWRLAEELASEKKDLKAAQAALRKGVELLAAAEPSVRRLAAERVNDPKVAAILEFGKNKITSIREYYGEKALTDNLPLMWYWFLADVVSFEYAQKQLETIGKELPILAEQGVKIPESIQVKLNGVRTVSAFETDSPMTIDGKFDEPVWQHAFPVECFHRNEPEKRTASAYTRIRVAYDMDNLYFAIDCDAPQNRRINGDVAEIFLKNDGLKGDYVHFLLKPNGTVIQQINRYDAVTEGSSLKSRVPDYRYACEGLEHKIARLSPTAWRGEMKIPLKSIGNSWKNMIVNFCRSVTLENMTEDSTINAYDATRGFHCPDKFPVMTRQGRNRFVPDIQINLSGMKREVKVMTQATGTVATFDIELNANVVLNNVRVIVETFGADGKLNSRQEAFKVDRLYYRWASPRPVEACFNAPVKKGAIQLRVIGEEGETSRLFRFGGWEGMPRIGYIFAPGMEGQALNGECFFSSAVKTDSANAEIFSRNAGTVEFFFKPSWRDSRYALVENLREGNCFVHFGTTAAQYRYTWHDTALLIAQELSRNAIDAVIADGNYLYWQSGPNPSASSPPLSGWNHLAVVWDTESAFKQSLRIYLNGKLYGEVYRQRDDHFKLLGDKAGARMPVDRGYPVQIGARNSGLLPMDAIMDDLRISRAARYLADFTPPTAPLPLDDDTTAYFDFNGNLVGKGKTENGRPYEVSASAGIYLLR